MTGRKRGFTLPELLIVVAILALVAAITFPVMRAAKDASRRTACSAQFHQAQVATSLYLGDYDDHFMPVNYQVGAPENPEKDRTWVQLLLPYVETFDIFRCPADSRHRLRPDAVIDIDLVPGDTYARYYRASLLTNLGYNYLYLSPASRTGNRWIIEPRMASQVSDPSSMLLFVDSIADRDRDRGSSGGGSYIVAPPCRYVAMGPGTVDSFMLNAGAQAYAPTVGWTTGKKSGFDRYGRAWPWHGSRATMALVGGGVKPITMDQLSQGCDVQNSWNGRIRNTENYFWDLQ